MKTVFIKNPKTESTGLQIVGSEQSVVTNEGPEGAVVVNDKRAGVCLSPVVELPVGSKSTTDTITLTGHFVVELNGVVIPFIFEDKDLGKYFKVEDPHSHGVAFIEQGQIGHYVVKNLDYVNGVAVRIYQVSNTGDIVPGTDFIPTDSLGKSIGTQLLRAYNVSCEGAMFFAGLVDIDMVAEEETTPIRLVNGSGKDFSFATNDDLISGLQNFWGLRTTVIEEYKPPVVFTCAGANAILKTINPVMVSGNTTITKIETRDGVTTESDYTFDFTTPTNLAEAIQYVFGEDTAIKMNTLSSFSILIVRIGGTGYDSRLEQIKYKVVTDGEITYTPSPTDIVSPAVSIQPKSFMACFEVRPVQNISCVGEPDGMLFPGGINLKGFIELQTHTHNTRTGYKNIATFNYNSEEFVDIVTALQDGGTWPKAEWNGVGFERLTNGDVRTWETSVSESMTTVFIRATEMNVNAPTTGTVAFDKLSSDDQILEYCLATSDLFQ